MTEEQFKQVCECKNCGNEAEMVVTCSMEEVSVRTKADPKFTTTPKAENAQGRAMCSHCGNEADIWLDI